MTKIKIGLFGFGVVGQGIYEVVRKSKNAHAEIVKICVRDPKKPRKIEVDPSLFTTSVDDILDNQNINLVVEVIDDADAAYNIVKRAMLRGIPVVSGSKTMLAKHLPELIEIQKTRNVALLYDASSCGSIPVIRNLEEYYDNDLLLEVKGILNGSSNYILSRVFDHKDSYANALAQAQALGFAESDPSFDIEGYDSLFKLVIITVHALGTYVAPERIFTYGISTIHDSDIQYAREKNVKIKLVAQVVKVSDEHFTMFVMPEFVTPAKYIYSVDDEYNGVVIRGECYDRQFMFGKGAGSGWLHNVFAANTDMVFAMICEELGLIIALCSIAAILVLAFFAVRSASRSRSAFYSIAACATVSMLLVQLSLNVFGSLDILPFTGVTFPFVSRGGTSLLSCWMLMAFIKGSDTRREGSFAVRPVTAESRAEEDEEEDEYEEDDYDGEDAE